MIAKVYRHLYGCRRGSIEATIPSMHWLYCVLLWSADERTPDVQYLVSWDQVCRSKDEGRLVVCDLSTQNDCLLLKMIHCLHSTAPRVGCLGLGGARWLPSPVGGRLLYGGGGGALELPLIVPSYLPSYHQHRCRRWKETSFCNRLPLWLGTEFLPRTALPHDEPLGDCMAGSGARPQCHACASDLSCGRPGPWPNPRSPCLSHYCSSAEKLHLVLLYPLKGLSPPAECMPCITWGEVRQRTRHSSGALGHRRG
jgi:hypothetical protein